MANTIQTVGLTAGGAGVSLVASPAGDSQNPILVVKSLKSGAGISIVAGDSNVDVTIAATNMPELTSLITGHVHWIAGGASPANLPIFTAAFPVLVTAIIGRVEQASGAAATLTLVKAPEGVAISAGIALSTAPFDAAGVAAANQTLTLTPDITTLLLAVGDSIGVKTTGTWTNACGGITIHMAPAPDMT